MTTVVVERRVTVPPLLCAWDGTMVSLTSGTLAVTVALAASQSSPRSAGLLWGAAEGRGLWLVAGSAGGEGMLLVWRVIQVDWADESTDSASVEDGVEVVEGALADASDGDGVLLAESSEDEDEDEALVGFGIACLVSTIVTETETVVASGSSTAVDFVTVWYTVAG